MRTTNKHTKSLFVIYSKNWFKSSKQVTIRSKLKSIVISLILGLIVAFTIMTIATRENPFSVFGTMVATAFGDQNMFNYTLVFTGLLLVSGVANAIAFRTGLFNIGVSGQMFFTGAMSIILGLTLLKNLGVTGLIILIWFGAITGGIVAGFIGWLKVRFNVNEVVTSILLNWGLFYLARYIIAALMRSATIGPKITGNGGGTQVLPPEFQMSANYYGVIMLLIGLVIALIVGILLWKSVVGHAMKMTGKSIDASKYAGVNVNKHIIMSMAISGIIAGILGVMFFVIKEKQIGPKYMNFNQLPNIGFEGIAIALLAFSNPLGIIPIAFIFGILRSGSSGLVQYSIDNSFADLIVGIMMYFAAISILFMRFKPIQLIYTWFRVNEKHLPNEFKNINEKFVVMNNEYKVKSDKNEKLFNKAIDTIKEKIITENNLFNKKNENSSAEQIAKQENKHKEIIKKLNQEIKSYMQDISDLNSGYKNIKKHRNTQIKLLKIKKQRKYYERTHQYISVNLSTNTKGEK